MDKIASANDSGDRISNAPTSQANYDTLELYMPPNRVVSGQPTNQPLPAIDMVDFKSRAEKLLKGVGTDEDNHYKLSDLSRLVDDPSIKGQDAIAAAALYRIYRDSSADATSTLNADGTVTHQRRSYNNNFGPADFDQMAAPSAQINDDYAKLLSLKTGNRFNDLDRDGDGRLSHAELAADPALARAIADVPFTRYTFEQNAGGMGQEDISDAISWMCETKNLGEMAALDNDYSRQALSRATNRNLYADAADPLKNIKSSDVNQGTTGDCYFESVLADVARLQPELISNAIRDNHNGTYTVTFKGDADHPVTVKAPTDTELALYSNASADGIWPVIMEKAYAQHEVDNKHRNLNGGTPQDAVEGGDEINPIKLLTGNDSTRVLTPASANSEVRNNTDVIWNDPAKVQNFIETALDNHSLIGAELFTEKANGENGMVVDHSYSLVGYRHAATGDSFILRDPRGSNTPDGLQDLVITSNELSTMPLQFVVENRK